METRFRRPTRDMGGRRESCYSGVLMRFFFGAAAVLFFSCGTRLPHPPYAPHPTSALVEVRFPPPPARAEAVPAQPSNEAVWVDGEWQWRRRKWAWAPGSWVVVPPGGAFSPWTVVRDDNGTLFHAPGTWRNARGEAVPAPKPIALGEAPSGVVVDPEGEIEHPGRNIAPNRPLRAAPDAGPTLDAGTAARATGSTADGGGDPAAPDGGS
jgi:hypothetical protein